MAHLPTVEGLAALSICESLLISLLERGLLDKEEIEALLGDVIETHRRATDGGNGEIHHAVANLVASIKDGHNSVRHVQRRV